MFCIKIADINIRIDNKYSFVKNMCEKYIVNDGCDPDLTVSVSDQEIDDEIAVAETAVSRGYAESVCVYRDICYRLPTKFNGYLLHSALIEYEGRGYAFAAKSGTGKSTHIALWQRAFGDKVRIINGDKPIVRYIDDEFIAYGTPWCGKEGLAINASVPLKALCFIERAPENSIEPLSASDAVIRVFHQVLTPRDAETLDSLFALLDLTLKKIPCYLLKCNMDIEAAIVSYNGMKDKNKN